MSERIASLKRRTNLFLGVLVVVLVGIVTVAILSRQHLPPISPDQFRQARLRWQEAGPADYDITVVVTGRQAATYRVSVRKREVIQASRNGSPLRQRRTMGTWSIPGMFSTMQSDVENVERIAAGNATPQTPQVTMRGQFAPQFGYPSTYVRIERTKTGRSYEVAWQVTEFDANPSP